MGAGASAAAGDAADAGAEGAAAAAEGASAAKYAVAPAMASAADSAGATAESAQAAVLAALDKIEDSGVKEKAAELLEQVGDKLTPDKLERAAKTVGNFVGKLEGNALLAKAGGVCCTIAEEAGEHAPAVAEAIGNVLGGVAAHLPYISIATGMIGGVYEAFKKSKRADENVKNVLMWCTSVTDWLLLVANRVDTAGAESCIHLFKALQEGLTTLHSMCSKFQDHWRITKMLTADSFQEKLDTVKGNVNDLKEALRDYLDAETVEYQNQMLGGILGASMQTNAKLDNQSAQLDEIKAMIAAQQGQTWQQLTDEASGQPYYYNSATGESSWDAPGAPPEAVSEEDALFQQLQHGAGVDESAPIPVDDFLLAMEMTFLGGEDMPENARRGLASSIDRNDDGSVSKGEFLKFYIAWTKSGEPMEAYLDRIGVEAPAEVVPVTPTGNGKFISQGNGDRMLVQGTVMQIFNAASGDCVATVVNAMAPVFMGTFPWGNIQMNWTGSGWMEVVNGNPGVQFVAFEW